MITTDIYGKTLSSSFNSAISSYAQYVKPRITINWLDSRHVDKFVNQTTNPFAVTNDEHANTNRGSIGYYFSSSQALNGIERQSYTWAVCGAKDINGDVIKADGTWYAMPSENDENLEFGWWSGTKSTSNYSAQYSGYTFATSPYIEFQFQSRKVNKVRITTSEYYGQISEYRLYVYSTANGLILEEEGAIADGSYYQDHIISSSLSADDIYKIKVLVYSTKNPTDYARINEISPIYESDITDYVISYNVDRVRDLHESSLPISGSGSAKFSATLDNTDKVFNIFNSSSTYGKYMKKDLKVSVSNGWRIQKTNELIRSTELKANINTAATTITVKNGDIFPDGGAGNYYIATIDGANQSREIVLVNSKTATNQLSIEQRGYAGTSAKNHSAGATITFEPFEYVAAGEFYVDEWSSQSSSMTVGFSANDWTKFLAEKNITKGFLLQNSTVGDAIVNLLMKSNFPKAMYKQVDRYNKGSVYHYPKAIYNFSEQTIDRTGNNIILSNGLRLRLWAMPSGSESNVKDIVADALDKQLSKLDIMENKKSYIAPDATAISTAYSSNASYAVDYNNFSFTGTDGNTYNDYFNGVLDGYYIPNDSGDQDIKIQLQNGGARIYLDDTLIANGWKNNTSLTTITSRDTVGDYLNLTNGVPYRIRIEFFHPAGEGNFDMYLLKEISGFPEEEILASECKTIAVKDIYGSRDASFDLNDPETNHHENTGAYIGNVQLSKTGGLVSDTSNYSVYLNGGYIRIPHDTTIQAQNEDFTYEAIVNMANNGSGWSDFNGAYLSSFANSSPANGFEFFNNSTSGAHGFKVVTTTGVQSVSISNSALQSNTFHHVIATFNSSSKVLKYYVDGVLKNSATITGNVVTQTSDITVGGRGASHTDGTGESAPSVARVMYIDEFAIYKKELSSTDVLNRYISMKIQPLTVYPFLYSNDQTIKNAIDDISFADLGRFYIDEENYGRYEHYYRLFESSIPQHSNVQYTLAGNSNIIDADFNVQLQTNKVIVKIASIASILSGTQPLWRAESPTTLAVVKLAENISNSQTSMYVTTTTDPPFFDAGYVIVDSEIIKYSAKTENSFLQLERGMFNTTPASHTANTKVREVRYYDINYDKAPAFSIKSPFVTGILDEEPDQINILRFEPTPYTAELIISASTSVDSGSVVFAEGTNPLTQKVAFTSIAGIPVITTEQSGQIKEQVSNLQDNIRKYGLKEITIESPYITDASHAQKLADFIISKMGDPVPVININIMCVPTIQLGDKIRISSMDTLDISNGDYWVVQSQIAYGDSVSQTLTLRKVV